jgi:peptide-methionine (R)-S-oxide reductase
MMAAGISNMRRRELLVLALAGSASAVALRYGIVGAGATDALPATFEVTHTDAEWRSLLSPEAYDVLRREGTEAPGSSPLEHETRKGVFDCGGCALPLFSSDTKFDSGTGWPSFWQPLDNAVLTTSDDSFFMTRTAVSCRRCGGHLGHVFDDGPPPTGLRYCMNGVAMAFRPTAAGAA